MRACGQLHSVAARHLLHRAALIAIQHAQLPAHAASGQVGDDAVPNAGRRVVHGGLLEQFQQSQKDGGAGHDQFGAVRSDALNLSPAAQIERHNLAIESSDLRDRSFQAVRFIAPRASHAIDGANDGRRRG